MKTKTFSFVALGLILVSAVAVSYLISRPSLFVTEKSMPVFMGEEMVVQSRLVKAVKAVKVEKAVRINRAVKAEVAKVPQVAKLLPIMPPNISYRVLPQYPVSALEQGLQGTTVLSIYVGMSGTAKKVQVKSSSGVAELDRSAVAAVSQWKFNPATQGGSVIASWFELPVSFRIK